MKCRCYDSVMSDFKTLPSQEVIDKTLTALRENGFNPVFVATKEEAKKKVLELIPEGAEVMNMTSITLDEIGIPKEINESGRYNAVRPLLMKMDRNTQGEEMRKMGSAPAYTVGSVNAITEEGYVLNATRTGSQLPSYAYGSSHVIWVVGTQKITKNIDEGIKRIFEYVLPLEAVRANKAYNITDGSKVDKLLISYREEVPGRITLILVNEALGF